MKSSSVVRTIVAAALLVAAIAAPFAGAADDPQLDLLLKSAAEAEKAGEAEKAAEAWMRAVERYPKAPEAAGAWLALGDYYLNKKNYGWAYSHYGMVADQFPGSPFRVDGLIGVGASLNGLKRVAEAESALLTALPLVHTPGQRAAALYHLGDSLFLMGKNIPALERLVECWNIPGRYRDGADRRVREILHVIANERELLSVVEKYKKDFPAQVALLELARYYGNVKDALNLERTRARLENDFPGATVPADVLEQTPPPIDQSLVIGCVLPLSGEQAEAASQALKGIQLAFSMKSGFVERAKLKLTIKDSGGDPGGASASMKDLRYDANVVAVVGMFGAASLATALEEARPAELPVITPTRTVAPDVAPDKRRYLYEAALTDAGQAKAIGEYAMAKEGVTLFTVIYPAGPSGEETLAAFTRTVEKNGGAVVQSVKYDAAQTDFRAQMEAIGGLDDNAIRTIIFNEVQEHPEQTIENINGSLETLYRASLAIPYITKVKSMPIVKNNFHFALKMNYQGVFIVGGHEEVGLILPALSFFNIKGVKVFGTDGYLNPELVAIGGKYAENVMFPAEFWPDNPRAEVKEFAEAHEAAMGGKPDAVTARYYDAILLLLALMENGAGSRAKIIAAMDELKYHAGVSGGVYAENGTLVKVPSIFTVNNGMFREVQPPAPPPATEGAAK